MNGRSHATKAVEGYRSLGRFASEMTSERPARVLDCASPSVFAARQPSGALAAGTEWPTLCQVVNDLLATCEQLRIAL